MGLTDLVSRITLRTVLKVRVWTSWTVAEACLERSQQVIRMRLVSVKSSHADISRHGDVRAPVRLAHDGDCGDLDCAGKEQLSNA